VSAALLILALLVLAATAGLVASCVRPRGLVAFLLAAYTIGFAEVVALSLLLSTWHALTRAGLLVGLAAVLAAALVVWQLRGRPRPPAAGPAAAAFREALRDPVLGVLAAAVGLGLVYSAALLLVTPPNDYDPLWYHLARAAFWKQQHAIAYVAHANDRRINVFPPNAEIGVAFTMILGRGERFVGLVQWCALLATMLGIVGISLRLGLTRRQALFGALVFGTLPVVALQASTGLNDIVVASFLVIAVYFAFSTSWTSLALAALALGLAIGTKATAVLALPVVAVVCAFMHPRARWPRVLLAGLAAIAIGCVWYVVNAVETGSLGGKFAGEGSEPDRTPSGFALLARLGRMTVDAIDPAGSVGRDRFLYAVAAALLLVVGALAALRRRRSLLGAALLASALILLPLAFRPIHHVASRAEQKVLLELGSNSRLAFVGSERSATDATPFGSWYGPLGLLLFLTALPVVVREVRRRRLPRIGLVLALAPALFVLVMTVFTFYSAFGGRYVMFAVALACATWGVLLSLRPLAWATAGIAATTLVLAFVHYTEKPAGFSVLGGASPPSVWHRSHVEIQSRSLKPGEVDAVRALSKRADAGASIGLLIAQNDLSYPYFGPRLDRTVVFLGKAGQNLGRVQWLVLSPGKRIEACPADWRRVPGAGNGWAVYRRVGRLDCGGEVTA
jgi:hypothetical protein